MATECYSELNRISPGFLWHSEILERVPSTPLHSAGDFGARLGRRANASTYQGNYPVIPRSGSI